MNIAAGTPSLGKFGFVQKKDEKKNDANDDNDDLDNSEDNFDQSNVVPEVVGEKKRQDNDGNHDDDDGERSKKKVKSSILDDFKKPLDKKMDDEMAHLDQKIESVNRHVKKLKKVDQNKNEAPEKTDEELKNMILNCTDIEMLEEVLESEALGIKEVVDIKEEIRAGLRLWGARGHIFVGGPDHIFRGPFSNSNRSYKLQYNKIKTLNHWCSPKNPLYMREKGKITNALYTNLKCLSAVCEMKRARRGNRNVRQY